MRQTCLTFRQGFTLLEVILVFAVVAVISGIGLMNYQPYISNQSVASVAETLKSDLRNAEARALASEEGLSWGVRLVNPGDGDDYYELFKTPTDYSSPDKVVTATVYLPGVQFQTPAAGDQDVIVFTRLSGIVGSSHGIILIYGNQSQTINVTVDGLIS